MLYKLAVKYLKRKGYIIMHQAEGMKTIGYDANGNKYVFFRKWADEQKSWTWPSKANSRIPKR